MRLLLPLLLVVVTACAAPPPSGPGAEGEGEGEGEAAPLRINEVSGLFGDYVELINSGDAEVDASGFFLFSLDSPTRAQVLVDAVVPAGGLFLVEGDALEITIEQVGTLDLRDADGALIDHIAWTQPEDRRAASFGRFPDGEGDVIAFDSATPAAPNRQGAPPASPFAVVINEVRAGGPDAVEVLRGEDGDSEVQTFWAIDNSLRDEENHRLLFQLFPLDRAVLLTDGFFGLRQEGDDVFVFDSLGRLVDEAHWQAGEAFVSFCRLPDGVGELAPCAAASLGVPNE